MSNHTTRRAVMFLTMSLVYMLVFLHGIIMTAVAKDIMRDMNLSPAGMGTLGSSYMYMYAATILFSGAIAAFVGPRLTLTLTFVVSGLGGLLFAWSESLWPAMIGRGVSSIGMACIMTSAFTLFGRWYDARSFSRVCSIFFAIGSIGIVAGSALAAWLTAELGWREVFRLISILTIVYAALVYLTVRDWPPDGFSPGPRPDGEEEQRRASVRIIVEGVKQASRSRDYWLLIIWFICIPGVYFASFGLWAIPYLRDVHGVSEAGAGAMASLAVIGFIPGSPLTAWLCDSVFRSYRAVLAATGFLTAAAFAWMLIANQNMGMIGLYVFILWLGIVLNAPMVAAYSASRTLFGSRTAGIISGSFAGSGFVSGAFLQILSGALLNQSRRWGWEAAPSYALAFSPLLICGLLAGVSGLLLSRDSFPRPKS